MSEEHTGEPENHRGTPHLLVLSKVRRLTAKKKKKQKSSQQFRSILPPHLPQLGAIVKGSQSEACQRPHRLDSSPSGPNTPTPSLPRLHLIKNMTGKKTGPPPKLCPSFPKTLFTRLFIITDFHGNLSRWTVTLQCKHTTDSVLLRKGLEVNHQSRTGCQQAGVGRKELGRDEKR